MAVETSVEDKRDISVIPDDTPDEDAALTDTESASPAGQDLADAHDRDADARQADEPETIYDDVSAGESIESLRARIRSLEEELARARATIDRSMMTAPSAEPDPVSADPTLPPSEEDRDDPFDYEPIEIG